MSAKMTPYSLFNDSLANGELVMGAIRLAEGAGAKIAGVGILIEKSFQNGRQRILDAGYRVYSHARLKLGEGHRRVYSMPIKLYFSAIKLTEFCPLIFIILIVNAVHDQH